MEPGYDPTDYTAAVKTAAVFGETIPIGVIFKNKVPTFIERQPVSSQGPPIKRAFDPEAVKRVMDSFG